MLSNTHSVSLLVPSDTETLGSQFNFCFALSQFKNNEVGIVGLDKSYLIFNFFPDILIIFFTKLLIEIEYPAPQLSSSNLFFRQRK